MVERSKSRGLATEVSGVVFMMALCLPTALSATSLPNAEIVETPSVGRSPASGETLFRARLNSAVCVAISLPQEWRQDHEAARGLRLVSSRGAGEIEISSRSVRDLSEWPQADAVSRDAALLQHDHEDVLGRKAQTSALEPIGAGARWTATWTDFNLPAPSHSLTLETYIVPASRDWLLEVSISDVDDRGAYDDLVQQVLSGVQTTGATRCSRAS
jgi:hypothetical protein